VEASASRAMDNYRRFLELQKTDPQLRAEALRRLGDLNMEAGEGERMAGEASTIDMQGAEAIKLYTSLLKSYPDYPRNDQVLYQLARAYETTGQPEKALQTLNEIIRKYPKAPQLDEVQFRRGELLFSARDYRGAESAYHYVVTKGDKAAFLSQSLYKQGWSLFKLGLNDESLLPFSGVLDRTMLEKGSRALIPLEKLPRASKELADDTLRVMAVTFSYEDDSIGAADKFLVAHGNPAYAPSSIRVSATCTSRRNASRTPPRCIARSPRASRTASSRRDSRCRRSTRTARAASRSWCSTANARYVALYNYGTPFWQGSQQG
jgi:tetratricopeptide (TPR) repeat protein